MNTEFPWSKVKANCSSVEGASFWGTSAVPLLVAASFGCDAGAPSGAGFPSLDAVSFASLPSLGPLAGAGGGGIIFNSICRILARSVGLPGFGPWITVIDGLFSLSLSFLPLLFSMLGTSRGMISPIAFQKEVNNDDDDDVLPSPFLCFEPC
ncbi:hypothetical protein Ahy_B03g063240 isoform D [Arachis hypogaea]|uniref:Uncharacterized protein n=1 Tax=Arachis hypogaea TaxID=3818 RepID=A0A444ZX66_ARAHY|nr:hypothetical protein Ahy_B03g063240 isoform D [Arachis hypogaea]